MAHVVDIDGKTWSLASRTDSMGRVYARALFMQLRGLQAHLHRSTSVYVAAVPGEKLRRLAQLLGIGKLPQRLER